MIKAKILYSNHSWDPDGKRVHDMLIATNGQVISRRNIWMEPDVIIRVIFPTWEDYSNFIIKVNNITHSPVETIKVKQTLFHRE